MRRKRVDWAGILFALLFPTLLTWGYFILARSNPELQKGCYGVGKVVQFLFPVLWTVFLLKEPIFSRNRKCPRFLPFLGLGLLFGLVVAVGMILLWVRLSPVYVDPDLLTALRENLSDRFSQMGLHTIPLYCAVAIFYSVIHSGLEEYYWRWFVFGRLREHLAWSVAAVVSSLGFSLHHILILGDFFGFTFWTFLTSAGVFIGGLFWSWLYQKSRSLYGAWLGHGLIDAAIFVIGARLLFSGG